MSGKKKIFILTSRQWIFVAVIVALIAVFYLGMAIPPLLIHQPTEHNFVVDTLLAREFEAEYQAELQREREAEYKARFAASRDTTSLLLQPFDPNTSDSLLFRHLGLSPYQIRSLLAYRRAGAFFRRPEDLRRLRWMNDSIFASLLPYVEIMAEDELLPEERIVKRDTILELNSADTLSLQYIRGVGSYTARRIILYRDSLGGYYSLDQLREISGIARLDSILPHLVVDTSLIRPLYVNKASIKSLYTHPYIHNYETARAIYDKRRNRPITTLSELADILGQDPSSLERLRPYIDFSTK